MTDEVYSQKILAVRAASAVRRSSAWAEIPERVLGLPLRRITPATFSLLHGTENAFICGRPPTLGAVNDFILYHSPDFDPDVPVPRFRTRFAIAWRTSRALCPLRTPRRRRRVVRATNLLAAIRAIREIVARTWADALPGNEEESGPCLAASLQAELADHFAREYPCWPLGTAFRHTPLEQLFQLARCAERHHLGRAATYYDREEAALTRDYLAALNAEAIAASRSNASAVSPEKS